MAETSAGSIIGTLRLTITDFETGIAKAAALADSLDGKNVNVDVKVDSGMAEAKLAAVAASEEKVDRGNVRVAKSGQDAGRGMGALATAIITLGPALVPLAAGAAGLAVGFGAMGAAGILAVVGIAKEMKSGSSLGASYNGMLNTLKGDLTTLGHTAAAGVLQPFQAAVRDLQSKMPALNGIIGEFSVITGKTAGALMSGLVSAFIALAPLARDAGIYIMNLTQRFASMMSGPGVVSFGSYVQSIFPQVMAAFESIVGAALRLVAALAPLGTATLGILKTFADLINAIPVEVLSALATAAAAVYIGFKTFGLAAVGIQSLTTAIEFLKLGMAGMLTAMGPAGIAAAVIGTLVAGAAIAFTAHSEAARKDAEAVNTMTDALHASGGALDESIRKLAYKTLVESGAIATAKQYGINTQAATSDALGNAYAHQQVASQVQIARDRLAAADATANKYASTLTGTTKNIDGSAFAFGNQSTLVGQSSAATVDGTQKLDAFVTSVAAQRVVLTAAQQALKDETDATMLNAAAGDAGAKAQVALAASMGITLPALILAQEGQKKTADAAALAAAKMYLENDAAGILRAGLDLLNGKALGLAQAQTADADATNKAAEALKANKGAIDGNSTAAIANQQALQRKAEASQREAEAVGKATGSTVQAIAAYKGSKTALEGTLRAQGLLTPAVQAYINKLYDVNNLKVKPTKLDVDKAAADAKINALQAKIDGIRKKVPTMLPVDKAKAEWDIAVLQAQIDRLRGKTIVLNVVQQGNANKTSALQLGVQANGGIVNFANGGIQAFASGGESHVAQIAPAGAMRLWAEPETGGEAYIPLAQSKRGRSTAILNEVASRFGMGASVGTTVNLTVNPSQGMDERQLAQLVIGELDRVTTGGLTRVGVS